MNLQLSFYLPISISITMTRKSSFSSFDSWESPSAPLWKQFVWYFLWAIVLVGLVAELTFFFWFFS